MKSQNKLKEITSVLACPVDYSRLEYNSEFFCCLKCGRKYPVLGNNFVELIPESPFSFNSDGAEYWKGYKDEFERGFTWLDDAKAWGRCDLVSDSWAEKRRRQVEQVKSILDPKKSVCDVSAGAGTYTFEFAKDFPLVIHCDLSVENLNDVYSQKQQKAVDNFILIRCDYFNLPFNNSLQQLVCTDTLIRGQQHEIALLNSLYRALSDGGRALVDFHNWWHNPLRRLGLMPQNFGYNKSYTRTSAEKIFLEVGIYKFKYCTFYQEIRFGSDSVLRQIIPPTRLMYQFKK